MKELIKKYYTIFAAFFITVLIICFVSLLSMDHKNITGPEIGIMSILILILIMFPIISKMKLEYDLLTGELKRFGAGYFHNYISIPTIIGGFIIQIASIGSFFIYDDFGLFKYLFLGVFWIIFGFIKIHRSFISISDKMIKIKDQDFYPKSVSLIDFDDARLILTSNNTLHKFDLSRFSKEEINKIIYCIKDTKFGDKLNVA